MREIIGALLPLDLVPQHVHPDPFETGRGNSLDAVVPRLDDMDVHAQPARHGEIGQRKLLPIRGLNENQAKGEGKHLVI